MKKIFALLTLLLAIVFQGFAQDTITGVVNRVAAPYFEQNACDSRFALSTGSETYYVMIDNYWPNKQATMDFKSFKGLAIIQIVFENGQTASRKVVIQ